MFSRVDLAPIQKENKPPPPTVTCPRVMLTPDPKPQRTAMCSRVTLAPDPKSPPTAMCSRMKPASNPKREKNSPNCDVFAGETGPPRSKPACHAEQADNNRLEVKGSKAQTARPAQLRATLTQTRSIVPSTKSSKVQPRTRRRISLGRNRAPNTISNEIFKTALHLHRDVPQLLHCIFYFTSGQVRESCFPMPRALICSHHRWQPRPRRPSPSGLRYMVTTDAIHFLRKTPLITGYYKPQLVISRHHPVRTHGHFPKPSCSRRLYVAQQNKAYEGPSKVTTVPRTPSGLHSPD